MTTRANVDAAARLAMSQHIDSRPTPASCPNLAHARRDHAAALRGTLTHHDLDDKAQMCHLNIEYWSRRNEEDPTAVQAVQAGTRASILTTAGVRPTLRRPRRHGPRLLHAQGVPCDLTHQLLAGSRQVAQRLDRGRRHEAAFNQPVRQQVGDPRRVLPVTLAARNVADVPRSARRWTGREKTLALPWRTSEPQGFDA